MAIVIEQTNTAKNTKMCSKLSLVDLAGSERLSKTEAEGERLKESLHINKSLSALGDVISALTSKKGHIPFRNSKLTHMLSDSLGNDSKTLLFVNASPVMSNAHESSCSLDFASRARNVDLSGGVGGAQMVKKWREAALEAQQLQRRNDDGMRALQDELALMRHAKEEAERERGGGASEVRRLEDELEKARRRAKEEALEAERRGAEARRLAEELEKARRQGGGGGGEKEMEAKLASALERAELAEKQLRAAGSASGAGTLGGDAAAAAKEMQKMKEQVAALTDINKQLLEKCKAAKEENRKLVTDNEQSSGELRALKSKHAGTLRKLVAGAVRPGSSGEKKSGAAAAAPKSKGATPR